MPLKVTSWNLEHADRLIANNPSDSIIDRRGRIQGTLQEIDPDILCPVEGPKGEQAIHDFCNQVLNAQWVPVLLRQPGDNLGDRDEDYQIRGTQWIWFLVKPNLAGRCRIQAPAIWQSFIGSKSWKVNYWGQFASTRHSHYRHPQVMIFDAGNGAEIEFIGVHLKSKINKKKIVRDQNGELVGAYVDEATKARIKLSTEARNIRDYIAVKFNQLQFPGIIVMGDCNDGPGRDYFETQYLFFDLIGNLQGEVLIAERFFNHALFDFAGHLRWTARYPDKIQKIPASQNPLLLDHILISQPLCRGHLPLAVNAGAGSVEHQAFERFNSGANNKTRTSDHRPVSCRLDDVP